MSINERDYIKIANIAALKCAVEAQRDQNKITALTVDEVSNNATS